MISSRSVSHSWKVVTIESREHVPRLVICAFIGSHGVVIRFTFVEGCHHRTDRSDLGHEQELRYSLRITVFESRRTITIDPVTCFTFVEGCHQRIDRKSFRRILEVCFSARIPGFESHANVLSTLDVFHIRGRLSPVNCAQ